MPNKNPGNVRNGIRRPFTTEELRQRYQPLIDAVLETGNVTEACRRTKLCTPRHARRILREFGIVLGFVQVDPETLRPQTLDEAMQRPEVQKQLQPAGEQPMVEGKSHD